MKRFFILPIFFAGLLLCSPPASAVEVLLKFSGGLSYLSLPNIDRLLQDWVEWKKKDTEAHAAWTFLGGEATRLQSGFDFEGEIVVSITPRIAAGIGAGYLYSELSEEKTALTIERVKGTFLDVKPVKVSTLPLTLMGYYFFPLDTSMRLYVKGGVGLLWGKYIEREGRRLTANENFSYQFSQMASGRGAVFLGGLGFDFEFEQGLRVFFEGSARMSRISNFEGDNEEELEILYHFEEYDQDYNLWQTKYQVRATAPSGTNYRSVQKAVIDIRSLSIKLGLSFKF
ncbi:MAG: hypothetical protein PVF22_02215 [Candidatus Aminicenantes bacterium]|jgi:hypothetical protein